MTSARDLRTKVSFQQRGLDANGDRLGDWEDGLERKASIRFLRGGEGVLEGRLAGRMPAVISIRDDSDTREITSAWRARTLTGIAYTFDIKSITPAKERGYLDILSEAGAQLTGDDE